MAHYGVLRDYKAPETVKDIRGANVYGLEDEKIGTIDDLIFDHSTGDIRYAVVDSGGWLKSRKFLVPADRIFSYAKRPDDFVVGVTKEQIKEFPPYNDKHLESEDDWKRYEAEFKNRWQAGPVQHREGSDRDITPDDVPAVGGSSAAAGEREINAAELYPDPIHDKFETPMPGGGKLTEHPRGTVDRAQQAAFDTQPLGERWSAFEEHLRRNRVDIQAKCPQCAPARERKDVA